jgi:hypothetical protein
MYRFVTAVAYRNVFLSTSKTLLIRFADLFLSKSLAFRSLDVAAK